MSQPEHAAATGQIPFPGSGAGAAVVCAISAPECSFQKRGVTAAVGCRERPEEMQWMAATRQTEPIPTAGHLSVEELGRTAPEVRRVVSPRWLKVTAQK